MTVQFECHQHDGVDVNRRVCAGWAGCHDGDELLALRLAVHRGGISVETARAVVDYCSPVPLFATGADAARHGLRDLDDPSPDALNAIKKIQRARSDLVETPTVRRPIALLGTIDDAATRTGETSQNGW